jgi:hypothetical protein
MKKRTKEEVWACRGIREAWMRSPLRYEALRRVKVKPNEYKCEGCGKIFKYREVEVDHVKPVVPEGDWDGLQQYAYRMYCPPEQLRVLCADGCHLEKTNAERTRRKKGA